MAATKSWLDIDVVLNKSEMERKIWKGVMVRLVLPSKNSSIRKDGTVFFVTHIHWFAYSKLEQGGGVRCLIS